MESQTVGQSNRGRWVRGTQRRNPKHVRWCQQTVTGDQITRVFLAMHIKKSKLNQLKIYCQPGLHIRRLVPVSTIQQSIHENITLTMLNKCIINLSVAKCNEKSRGLRIDPWGTPYFNEQVSFEVWVSIVLDKLWRIGHIRLSQQEQSASDDMHVFKVCPFCCQLP